MPMDEQDVILMAAYKKVLTDGSFEVVCKSPKEAANLRWRVYAFLKKFRKDTTLGGGERDLVNRGMATSMLVIEGNSLWFKNRADIGGMAALVSIVGEDAKRLQQANEEEVEASGKRLLGMIEETTNTPYPTHRSEK